MKNALWDIIPEYQSLTCSLRLKQIDISGFVFHIQTEQTKYASGSWPGSHYCN